MRQKLLYKMLTSASVCAIAGGSGNVRAEPVPDRPPVLEEIIVTARKHAESMQNVPVVVAAISKADLANNLASDLSNIGELAPQVLIGRSPTGTGAVITIRGISSAAVDAGVDQSVSLDVDGVSLSRGRIVEAAQFDLQQVQILEGPQALFFGKNSPAGVISIKSVDPTSSFSGYAKAGYEAVAAEKYVEGVVSGPITDTLKARLAVRGSRMNGWIKNNAPPEANPFDPAVPLPGAVDGTNVAPRGSELSARFTAVWEPANDFSAKFKLMVNRERLNGNDTGGESYCIGGQTVPLQLGVPQPHNTCAIDMVQSQSNLPQQFATNYPLGNGGVPYERSDVVLSSLVLTKRVGKLALTSTSGYYDQNHKGGEVADETEYPQIYDTEGEVYRQFSEELRANTEFDRPINGMVGVYYEHSHRRWINVPDLFNLYNSLGQNYTTVTGTSLSDNDSYSAFGQLRWKIVPSVEIAAGVRYSHDEKETTITNFNVNPAAGALGIDVYPANTPLVGRFVGDSVSPEVTVTWKPSSDQTVYAAFKEGYKAGGISNGGLVSAGTTPAELEFGPERADGFELGYKADLFDRRLRVDLAGYRYNYDGLQVTEVMLFNYSIHNAAMARTYGVTGSFQWLASENLTFDGNIGWNHARFVSFPNSPCYGGQTEAQGCVNGQQNLAGQPLQRAPNLTVRLGADYKLDVSPSWFADLSMSGAHTSAYQTDTNYSPAGVQPAYWLLNAAIHLKSRDGRYDLGVIARNLTNSYYKVVTFQSDQGLHTQYYSNFSRPREVAVELSYNF